jgi:hypothetical protein
MTIQKLLLSLVEHKVKFLVICAWAFPVYGYMRNTYDIDIFFEPTKQNVKRVKEALKFVGYDGVEDLKTEQLLKNKTLFRQYVLDTDIHPFVAGVEFDDAWKSKKEVLIEKVRVYVPSLDNLISMKKAAGRKKIWQIRIFKRNKRFLWQQYLKKYYPFH